MSVCAIPHLLPQTHRRISSVPDLCPSLVPKDDQRIAGVSDHHGLMASPHLSPGRFLSRPKTSSDAGWACSVDDGERRLGILATPPKTEAWTKANGSLNIELALRQWQRLEVAAPSGLEKRRQSCPSSIVFFLSSSSARTESRTEEQGLHQNEGQLQPM